MYYITNVLALAQSYSMRIIRVRRELEVSLAREKCRECVVIAAKLVILLGVSFERPSLGQREGLRVLSDRCSVGHNDRRALARGPFLSSFLPSFQVY